MWVTVEEPASFKCGIEGIEERYRNILMPGTILVIGGHPGAGKTTLAMHICRANAIEGKKCLYVSTQEPEEKFLRHASRLGFDFYSLIASDLFRYYRYPMGSTEDTVENLLESLKEAIVDFKPRVTVIDSINSFIAAVKDDTRKRALLQNFFYNIAFETKGIVVLLAEVPLGARRIESLGDVEFVADTILLLRLTSYNGHLYRRLAVRKIRGAPITLAELPYIIKSNSGIKIIAPAARPTGQAATIRLCDQIDALADEIEMGSTLSFVSIGYSMPYEIPTMLMLKAASNNKAKLTIITYAGGKEVRSMIDRLLNQMGIDKELVSIYSIDSFELSLDELLDIESELVRRDGSSMVLRIGTEVLEAIHKGSDDRMMRRFLLLEKYIMRSMGVLSARLVRASNVREAHMYLDVSDVIFISDNVDREKEMKIIRTTTGEVRRVSLDELYRCGYRG